MSRMAELYHEQQILKESYMPTREDYEDGMEECDRVKLFPKEGNVLFENGKQWVYDCGMWVEV
jgi:hypothetical protein